MGKTARRNLVLIEAFEALPASGPKFDREKGIVYGVKALGHKSRNSHGVKGCTSSEYARAAMVAALPLYDGVKVRTDHPDRKNPRIERSVYDSLGVLRSPRVADEADGPAVRSDLHLNMKHPLAESVIEDVEKGLGLYCLSHNADASAESVRNGVYVIEAIGDVRSVDLVDRGATTRTLLDSLEPTVTKTLRDVLESAKPKWKGNRLAWGVRLLEMDEMGGPMDAPVEMAPEAEGDPDEAMKAAFRGAADKILDGMFDGSVEEADGWKKLKELYRTHGKLTAAPEPEAPPAEEKKEEPAATTESLRTEVAALKREKTVRELCEAEDVKPTKLQLKQLCLLEGDGERKEAVKEIKALSAQRGGPKSQGPTGRLPGTPPATTNKPTFAALLESLS